MDTPETHSRAPWLAMLFACVLLLTSVLTACRVLPAQRVSAVPERPSPRHSLGPDLRVRLRAESKSAAFSARGALRVYSEGEASPRWSGTGPLRVTRARSGFLISPTGAIVPGRTVRLVASDGLLTLGEGADAVRLEGEVRLVARRDGAPGAFDVVEAIPLERYLPGVLAKELYHHFAPEAYRAQAVAARSYALHERARRRSIGSHFDVEATTMDQAYGGASAHPRATEAARDTRGRALTWNGGVLRAYYSSTCGDRPASARDTWPVSVGYEFNTAAPIQGRPRSCACAESPRHRWTLERPVDEATARLRAWGRSSGHTVRALSGLRAIDAEGRNDAGRPNRYRVTDAGGKRFTLSAEELRVALNVGAPPAPKITPATRVLSGDLRCTISRDTLLISGRGFGHGVGLCQFGADGLARQGFEHREILARYYPGAAVDTLY